MQSPLVSILVAVRNEEKNILDCLKSLNKLDYPKEKLQILIGNDQSADNTKELVREFIKDKNHFQLIDIQDIIKGLKGKANVLANLSREAKGEFYFFTDADIQVPQTWIKTMLETYQKNKKIGIITGFTFINGQNLFAKLQAMEWSQALFSIKILSDLKIPTTAMGNNMMITKEAYEAVGGYENIPFSITEDFAIFQEITKKCYDFKHIINEKITAFSKPILGFINLLQQRKRWMNGALQMPFYLKSLLFLQALFLPFLIILSFISPFWALTFLLGKLILDSFSVSLVLLKTKIKKIWKYLLLMPVFTLYQSCLAFVLLIFYFLPIKTKWKGRSYE